MNAWIRESQSGKSLFAMAVLLALFLRILVPTGFMPTATSQGIVVQLCAGMDGPTVVIDVNKKTPAEKHQAADSPCVYAAGLNHALLATADLGMIQPLIYGLTIVIGRTIADLTINRLAAPPPPSQAPPALS
jgi:hypothetical protein